MKNILKNLLETMKINKELFFPALLAVFTYLPCYQIPKFINLFEVHYLSFPIDEMIPLIPAFVVVYLTAFAQWTYCIIVMMKQEKKLAYYFFSAIMIGSFIGFLFFTFYPTAIVRTEIKGSGIFDWMLRIVYWSDSIKNAFPSFHCFCSAISAIMLWKCKDVKKPLVYFNIFFSFLVFASTVFTKQHYFIDIFGGIALAFVSILIAKKITFTKLFDSLNDKFIKMIS